MIPSKLKMFCTMNIAVCEARDVCIFIAICLDLTPDLRCFRYNVQVPLSTAPVSKTSRYAIGSNVVSVVQTGVLILLVFSLFDRCRFRSNNAQCSVLTKRRSVKYSNNCLSRKYVKRCCVLKWL